MRQPKTSESWRDEARPWLRRLRMWTALGLGLRLLLLPVGLSSDTLAVYWRAHVIAFDHRFYADYLVNTGSHLIHAGWLWVIRPFTASPDALWTDPWWWRSSYALEQPYMDAFLRRDDALRHIALLKLPYALADVAAGVVLLLLVVRWAQRHHAGDPDTQWRLVRRSWIFWMLSPAMLYATVVFGRYESFPVLAVLLALLLAERDRPVAAMLTLGLAVTLRTYPLVLVPAFALVLGRTRRRQVGYAAVALAPFLVTMALNEVVAGTPGELADVSGAGFSKFWFAYAIQPAIGPGIVALVMGLAAATLWVAGSQLGWWARPIDRDDLWRWVVVLHLVIFATAQFSLHYVAWLTPAIALLLGRSSGRGILPLHLVQLTAITLGALPFLDSRPVTGTLGGLGRTATTLLPPFLGLSAGRARVLGDASWSVHVVVTAALLALAATQAVRRQRAQPG